MGSVQKGGIIKYFDGGSAIANFYVMTHRMRLTAEKTKERKADFHRVQVKNIVFDDLEELIKEGNIVHISGESTSYEYNGVEVKYIKADKCSIIGVIASKSKS